MPLFGVYLIHHTTHIFLFVFRNDFLFKAVKWFLKFLTYKHPCRAERIFKKVLVLLIISVFLLTTVSVQILIDLVREICNNEVSCEGIKCQDILSDLPICLYISSIGILNLK